MITLALRLFAGSLFKNLAGNVIKGWEWIFSSATHILEAALLIALLFGWHEHRAASRSDARWGAVVAQWQATNTIQRGTIATLLGALNNQSASVRAWSDTARRRQNAAQAALRTALARSKASELVADRIEREGAQQGSGGDCPSGDAIVAAKGEL